MVTTADRRIHCTNCYIHRQQKKKKREYEQQPLTVSHLTDRNGSTEKRETYNYYIATKDVNDEDLDVSVLDCNFLVLCGVLLLFDI